MIKAFSGKTYTTARENLWRDLDAKQPSIYATYTTINGYSRVSKQLSSRIGDLLADTTFKDRLLVSILENAQIGNIIKGYNATKNDFTSSWSITDADYTYIFETIYVCGKRNIVDNVAHLKFVSTENRYIVGDNYNTVTLEDLSLYFYITPLAVGVEQYIMSKQGSFSISIDTTNHIVFAVYDGSTLFTATSTNTVEINTQSRVVCIQNHTTGKMTIYLDAIKTETSNNSTTPSSNTNLIYVGCEDITGSKSHYLDACIHTLFIQLGNLTLQNILTIDTSIIPVGFDIVDYTYDNITGTATGIPYALKQIVQRQPQFEFQTTLIQNNVGEWGAQYE